MIHPIPSKRRLKRYVVTGKTGDYCMGVHAGDTVTFAGDFEPVTMWQVIKDAVAVAGEWLREPFRASS